MRRLVRWPGKFFALAAALSLAAATASPRQGVEVEIEGWDISGLDARVAGAWPKAAAGGAGKRERLSAASALLERANFFRAAGVPKLYKFAIGDYRRVLRFQPGNAEARRKLYEIVSIYESLARPVPENGVAKEGRTDAPERFKTRPQPLDFEPGHDSVEVSERVSAGRTAYVYEVSAQAGRRLSVGVESTTRAAVFSLTLEGTPAPVVSAATRAWHDTRAAGKYLIRVSSKKGEVAYKLKVVVR